MEGKSIGSIPLAPEVSGGPHELTLPERTV